MALIDNLVGYWKLDEVSGNAIDSVAGNNGTVTGCTQNQAGKIGQCCLWTVNTNKIDCGNPAALQLTTTGSISCWINPSSVAGDSLIVGKGNWGGDVDGYNFVRSTTRIGIELAGASSHQTTITGTGVIATGNWYHVVCRWDTSGAGYAAVYINGSEGNSGNNTQVPNSGVYNFNIGADPAYGFNGFLGNIDEVAVWSRMITTDEVTALYNGGNGVTYPFFEGASFNTKNLKFTM